jgi:hypothetical protein
MGEQHCHVCGKRVKSQSAEDIAREILSLSPATKLELLAPLVIHRKGGATAVATHGRRAQPRAAMPPSHRIGHWRACPPYPTSHPASATRPGNHFADATSDLLNSGILHWPRIGR